MVDVHFEIMLNNIGFSVSSSFSLCMKTLHPNSSKWKGDNSSVTSLCISPDGKMLLSAGRTIKLWDLETKEVYRVSNSVKLDAKKISLVGDITHLCFLVGHLNVSLGMRRQLAVLGLLEAVAVMIPSTVVSTC